MADASASGGTASQLEPYRFELLELAFSAASAFPLDPHAKNRSRAQSEVIAACFDLNQPERALAYAAGVEDWRRGLGYADYAFYCAERGDRGQAIAGIELADGILREQSGEQDWRRDRIRARIAQVYLLLGDRTAADVYSNGLADSERGRTAAVDHSLDDDDAFQRYLKEIDSARERNHFNELRNVLESAVQLYGRYFGDEGRREELSQRMRRSWVRLPRRTVMDLMLGLAEHALNSGAAADALAWVDEAAGLSGSVTWRPEDHIAFLARLASLRHRVGDSSGARNGVRAALEGFDSERTAIVDMFRTEALIPVAEAFVVIGDRGKAADVYRRALEEAVVNVNSRPRADDLVAVCCSLAVCGLEPDAELWSRLKRVRAELGAPW